MAPRGRHRRQKPRPASRASLTLTASGAGLGIALPLIGVSHAQAAPVEVWDKVATCESSSRWSVNTGNGYFGGLQFKQTTWQEFGGTRYAQRADQATKEQQIAIAEKVLSKQGPGAWPSCSIEAGLTNEAGTSWPQQATITPQSTTARQPATSRTQRSKDTSRNDGSAPRDEAAQVDSRDTARYEVRSGDNLSSIAAAHEVEGGWQRLYDRNRQVVGGNPDLILPGQRLALSPAGPEGKSDAPAAPRTAPKAEEKPAPAEQQKQEEPAAEPDSAPDSRETSRTEEAKEQEAEQRAARERAQRKASRERAAAQQVAKEKAQAAQKRAEEQKRRAEQKRKAQAEAKRKAEAATAKKFASPVNGYSPTTSYRASGGSWASGYHTGVDFAVPTGTSVRAVTSGTVVSAGWAGSYGYQVVVRHHDGRFSQYAHLSAISVRGGQKVNSGQALGRSGNTGNSSGPHLHFEVRTGPGYGSDVDPLAYLRGNGVRV